MQIFPNPKPKRRPRNKSRAWRYPEKQRRGENDKWAVKENGSLCYIRDEETTQFCGDYFNWMESIRFFCVFNCQTTCTIANVQFHLDLFWRRCENYSSPPHIIARSAGSQMILSFTWYSARACDSHMQSVWPKESFITYPLPKALLKMSFLFARWDLLVFTEANSSQI